ncbi:helix-turn-helix domain-containing protein [Nocardioides nitrophenolicus]|uniref:helix-turn-helix domain-containing protein n=1 Tax=Nocardioides nitrophenolicus TaxID=60489 RepID=UPI000A9F1159|nr:helix-turn-helix domain-containing protein [Nocardioides nitrophenolicus]MBM7518247.1 excisionase family DNA binding protein [Nocardioides nitrophenolicus]
MTSKRAHISLQEAADYLGVSASTVRRYVGLGTLPAYRIAGSKLIRVKRTDVEGLLKRIPTVESREY